MKTFATLSLEYRREFAVGELVKPACPECPLPPGVYEVERSVESPNGTVLILVKGQRTPVPTALLIPANAKADFVDPAQGRRHRLEFLKCQLQFPLQLILDEAQHDEALAFRDDLLAQLERSEAVDQYVRALTLLLEAFERKDAPPPPYGSDAAVFEFILETRGVTAREVARATGLAKSGLSRVHTGQARFSRTQISRLVTHFAVDPRAFFGPEPDLKLGGCDLPNSIQYPPAHG